MRIHYYSGSTLPSQSANSVHVMKMCEAWGKAGHEVTLFAKGRLDQDVYDFYGVRNCFRICAAPLVSVPVLGGVVRLVCYFFHSLMLGKPDLVYGRDALSLLLMRGKQTVFEAHQVGFAPFEKIVVISDGLKNDLKRKYPDAQYFVAPDGASLPARVSDVSLRGGQSVKIGYAGSLHPGKGLEIIQALSQKLPKYEFHVVGGDKEIKDEGNVFFYGHVPHQDVASYLQKFDILIAPYQKEARIKSGVDIARWISPLKIFEYMTAQRPMICSDLPVIREVLTDERNALLVAPDDIDGWVRAISRLIDDKDLRDRILQTAYKDLISKYTWDQRAAEILGFCSGTSSS